MQMLDVERLPSCDDVKHIYLFLVLFLFLIHFYSNTQDKIIFPQTDFNSYDGNAVNSITTRLNISVCELISEPAWSDGNDHQRSHDATLPSVGAVVSLARSVMKCSH